MSETLRDVLVRCPNDWHGNAITWLARTHPDIYAALIIRPSAPDAKPYIVTREAVEAAQAAASHDFHVTMEHNDAGHVIGHGYVDVGAVVRDVLTAVGPFVVADEVVEVVSKRLPNWPVTFGDAENGTKVLHDGDTIYIKRRESEEGV